MDIEPAESYLRKNQKFRNGIGYELNLTDAEQRKLKDFLTNFRASYALGRENNCGAPLLRGLRALGYDLHGSFMDVTPTQLSRLLLTATKANGEPLVVGRPIRFNRQPSW